MVSVAAEHLGPFTIGDLYRLPDDGLRYELIEGSIVVSPPPLPIHQWVQSLLAETLNQQLPRPLRAVEGVGVRCGRQLLIPDLLIASRAAFTSAARDIAAADVLAVAEIMSPGSRRDDRIRKPAIYAEAGIPAYLRIETPSDGAVTLIAHDLDGNTYRETARAAGGRTVALTLPNGIQVSLDPAELAP
jgi:Uma2 family endonuclease